MSRIVCLITVWTNLCLLTAAAVWAAIPEGPMESAGPREQIELADHKCYTGLIESEDGDWLTLIRIQMPRGKPMHLVIQPFDRRQVVAVSRLNADRRAALQRQIEEFRNRASIEAANMQAVRLGPWRDEGFSYRRYRGKWFTLDSTADEQGTRRVIVRAEQIFAAFRQILPPRNAAAQPPRLVVLGSMDQYQTLLVKLGLTMSFQNPACFLEDRNVVAIGSDLAHLAAVTRTIAAENALLRRDLDDLERRLPEHLQAVAASLRQSGASNGEIAKGVKQERMLFEKQVAMKNDELRKSDQQIDRLFKTSASQTLARLYHESFHAYLRDFVYPPQKYDVPPWLNEGLAMIFEGGMLEGSTLRVDAPNALALRKLKADLVGPDPLPLTALLAAGKGQFLEMADARPAAVDRYYAHAWGLAYYLTFEKRLLGSPALETYLQATSGRLTPLARFEKLIGEPADKFDQQWRAYIRDLPR